MKKELKTRRLRLESLEDRTLLAVVTGGVGESAFVGYDSVAAPMDTGAVSMTDIDVFKLSSNPGSSYSIYLDFNGHTTKGTVWNKKIVTPAFSLDSDKSSFSAAEKAAIYEIWLRVAEDFMPFDINVTTVEPEATAFAAGRAQRVAIGGKYTDWYGIHGSGISKVNSFKTKGDIPNFVFSETVLKESSAPIKSIAESVTHEVGHTLGLKHKEKSGKYFSGQNGWGPIMGDSGKQELSQWSKGEYGGATNKDDELKTITTQNGFGYRQDDFGNSRDGAGRLSIADGVGKIEGIIEKRTDVDWFVFESDGSRLHFFVGGLSEITNLDVKVELYSADKKDKDPIRIEDPSDRLNVEFDFEGAAGTYYLKVEGTGTQTGASGIYSDYGSLGAYSVQVGNPDRLVVTTLNDTFENDGLLSLREAIAIAPERAVITFDPKLSGRTINLKGGELLLTRNVTIDASSVGGITINAGGKSRVINVGAGLTNVTHVTGKDSTYVVSLIGLTMTGGKAENGGGVAVGTALKLTNCTVTGNTASSDGGGIYVFGSGNVTVTCSIVSKNTASNHYGGGIYNAGTLKVTSSVIAANSAVAQVGGGIFNSGSTTLVGSTVSGNAAKLSGGGIYYTKGIVTLTNTIVALNCAASNADIKGAYTPSHNIVGVNSDPGFVVAPVFKSGVLVNADQLDLSLAEGSAAINAGTNVKVEGRETDVLGKRRISDGTVDIGAYEYRVNAEEPSIIVTTTDDTENDSDGKISLREAIYNAYEGDTITFVKELAGKTITLGGTAIEITDCIGIDASAIGGITINAAGKSRVFDIAPGYAANPVTLTDLTITGGKAETGAGISAKGALVLTNCTVMGNTATTLGGGIYNVGTLTVTGSTISGNTAKTVGGGIYNSRTLTVTNSKISGNTASSDGGGIFNMKNASATLTNTFLWGNTATAGYGAGAYNAGALTVIGSVIAANSAKENIGGGFFNSGTLTVTCSTVAGNSAKNGGGIYTSGGKVELSNTIVASNYATYTDNIKGTYSAGSGDNIIAAEPGFAVAPVFKSGVLDNADQIDLSLVPGSAALDHGLNSAVRTETDIAGNPRVTNGTVDIGAYEYHEIPETPSTVVTVLDDIVNAYDGLISLREAISYAAEGETVTFDEALAGGTITLDGTQLEINKGIAIDASAIGGITIDAGGKSRVLYVSGSPNIPVSLTALTVTGGNAELGGGIYAVGSLSLINCAVTGNTAVNYGGGIYNAGVLKVTSSVIAANSAVAQVGGGIFNSGSTTLVGSTVSGNAAKLNGGGIYFTKGEVTLTNTIVALNSAASNTDIKGTYTGSHNIVGVDPGFVVAPVFESGVLVNADQLDLSLAAGSAAIDAGTNEAVVSSEADIAGNPRIFHRIVDIGAYEYSGDVESPSTVVTTDLDVVDEFDGLISLREAISYAAEGETVTFDEALAGGTITLDGTQLEINKGIAIDASAIGGITIDAGGKSRVFCVSGSPNSPVTMTALTVTGGKAESGGGILNTSSGSLTLVRCTVTGNSAVTNYGGGIYNAGLLTVTDSVISANSADSLKNQVGGGIFNSGTLTMTGSTVSGNTAKNGGGIYISGSGAATVTNTIAALNYAVGGADIKGSYTGSPNIVGVDPDFVVAPVFDESGVLVNADQLDLSLAEGSAAIDAGTNDVVVSGETDIAGKPRIFNEIVDIGAYEYSGDVERPSTVVTTLHDVADEFDGFISLREAISYAAEGETVTFDEALAGGTITLDGTQLEINKGIAIDASAIGGITIDAGGKSRVLYVGGAAALTALTVTGGNAELGGGIYNVGTLTVTNSKISGNTASSDGGGIFNMKNASATLTNTFLWGNTATAGYGAGAYNAGALTVIGSVIAANSAKENIGGGFFNSGTLTVTCSTVAGNSAKNGGGIYTSGGKVELSNTIVASNYATYTDNIKGTYSAGSGDNIIAAEPGFAVAPVFKSGVLDNADQIDLSLVPGSAALDHGLNSAVRTETDIAGNPRVTNGTVDIGAYEYHEIPETPSTVVTVLDDIVNAYDGLISLREAISYAAEGETVTFDEALAGGTITLDGTQLEINKGIAIDASAIGGITIDAGGKSRVLYVRGGSNSPVSLTALTITGGNANNGGAIFNTSSGSLTLTNSMVTENSVTNYGGGIYNNGTLTVTDSVISANSANTPNSPKNQVGGGVFSTGTLTLIGSTVSGNSAKTNGGGIYISSGVVELTNTIVAYNASAANDNVRGLYAGSNNIVGPIEPGFVVAPLFESGVLVNADALDLSLAAGSAAIDAGTNDAVSTMFDIAGKPRIVHRIVDIGAYEYSGDVESPSTVVTTLLDVVDEFDGLISLREAIFYAAEGETVTFDEALAGGTITLDGTQLEINKGIAIDASAIGGITIDAGGKSCVLYVGAGPNIPVSLIALTITGGNANNGGGIYISSGVVELTNTMIVAYNASAANGNVRGLYAGSNNIVGPIEPGFVVAPHFESGVLVNADALDLSLAAGSAAIDAGTNDAVSTMFDIDGNPRVTNGTVDFGAYEYVGSPASNNTPSGTTAAALRALDAAFAEFASADLVGDVTSF